MTTMTNLPRRGNAWSRLVIDFDSGCVLWAAGEDSEGYGVIRISGRQELVHRVMYEMFSGPIPEGLHLDHLCRVRHCANVAHLEPVTRRENILRGESPAAANASKTECDQGHGFDGPNTYVLHGKRYCRACNAATNRRYRARKAVA